MRMISPSYTPEDVAGLRVIVVPSGIGEFQWAWTKYINTGERFAVLALDGAPRRLHQFCALHPQIEAFGWVGFEYSQIREFQKFHSLDTWARVREMFELGSTVMLACNPHLEAGKPLAEWMPDLPTTYRYPISLDGKHIAQANRTLHDAQAEDFLIGISCASYRGAAAWHTWEHEDWTEFLSCVQRDFPHVKFVLLGGAWDDLTSAVFDPTSALRWQVDSRGLPPVGTMSFGGAVATLQCLDAYIGFSSGLGHVAAHLCNTPVFMLWPEHEQTLSTTWVDPELLDDGTYVPSRWLSPDRVYRLCKPWLVRADDRRQQWLSQGTHVRSNSLQQAML